MSKKRVAVYPGTFDPVHFGHIDVIERGAKLFDKLIVAVAYSDEKSPLFSVEERKELLEKTTASLPNVSVSIFEGMTVNYVREIKSSIILRGIRTMSDFDYEFQMALVNRRLAPDVETAFVMANTEHSFISGTFCKEMASRDGDLSLFLPDAVASRLRQKVLDE